jgi:CspA family cold shock protein
MGTVRWFDSGRGHGFVARDTGEPDCFLHQSEIRPSDLSDMTAGTRVCFEVRQELGGPSALKVERL